MTGRSIDAFHHGGPEPGERADIAGPVPGVRLAGRAADGFVAFQEAGDERLLRQRRQHHATHLPVIHLAIGVVRLHDFQNGAWLRRMIGDLELVGRVKRFVGGQPHQRVPVGGHEIDSGAQLFAREAVELRRKLGAAAEDPLDAVVGEVSIVGPYARLRLGARLGKDVHIGNFVEVKNSNIADHSKANHLAYIGDADIGQRVNVGAGTITCNYDGANKFRTTIEDDAFIGSDTQLVAPVTVGRGATLGAGTTLTKNAPPDQLTISRARQVTIAGWKRPVKLKK